MRMIALCLLLFALPVSSEDPAPILALLPPGAIVLTVEEQNTVTEMVAQLQYVAQLQMREIKRLQQAKGCL